MGFDQLGNMKDAAMRLTSLEHPLINIIALALITIGWSKHKKKKAIMENSKRLLFFFWLSFNLVKIALG